MPDSGGRKGYGNVGTPNGDSLHKSQEIRSVMLSWIYEPGEKGLTPSTSCFHDAIL